MAHHLKNNLFSEKELNHAWQLIEQASTITFLTHRKPDADGVSACTALSHIVEKKGKKVETIYPSTPEFEITRHPSNALVNQHKQIPDLLIMCDTANYDRLYYPDAFKTIPSINIDHHISNSINATINFIFPQISSTCELMYFLLQAWNIVPDHFVAQCLLSGILYDTQVFHIQSTTAQTLRIAADLIDAGAPLFQLESELLYNKNPEIIALWGSLLSSVQFSPNKNAAWCSITAQEVKARGLKLASLAGFSNFLAQLSAIDITIIFYESEDGKTQVSLRSKKADVNTLAAKFGGGGHKNASGITSNIPLTQLIKKLTALL